MKTKLKSMLDFEAVTQEGEKDQRQAFTIWKSQMGDKWKESLASKTFRWHWSYSENPQIHLDAIDRWFNHTIK